MEPRHHAWIVPDRVAVAERPGGGGRSHRAARRDAEQAWWRARGIVLVVSCMPTRHGLLDLALAGFAIRWHPLTDADTAPAVIARVAEDVASHLAGGGGPVLVHGDAAGEWLTALDAGLRLLLGVAPSSAAALDGAAAAGLPVGSLATRLVERCATERPHPVAA